MADKKKGIVIHTFTLLSSLQPSHHTPIHDPLLLLTVTRITPPLLSFLLFFLISNVVSDHLWSFILLLFAALTLIIFYNIGLT